MTALCLPLTAECTAQSVLSLLNPGWGLWEDCLKSSSSKKKTLNFFSLSPSLDSTRLKHSIMMTWFGPKLQRWLFFSPGPTDGDLSFLVRLNFDKSTKFSLVIGWAALLIIGCLLAIWEFLTLWMGVVREKKHTQQIDLNSQGLKVKEIGGLLETLATSNKRKLILLLAELCWVLGLLRLLLLSSYCWSRLVLTNLYMYSTKVKKKCFIYGDYFMYGNYLIIVQLKKTLKHHLITVGWNS